MMAISGLVMTLQSMEGRMHQHILKETNTTGVQIQLSNLTQQMYTLTNKVQQIQEQQERLLSNQQEILQSLGYNKNDSTCSTQQLQHILKDDTNKQMSETNP
jgi:hypothetical protein